MKSLVLTRFLTEHGSVLGHLDGLDRTIYTLEDEWRDNHPNVSCIPVGTYRAVPHSWEKGTTVRMPKTWELQNVKGRSAILIHAGNTNKDTEGCILVGMGTMVSQTAAMVTDSRMALEYLRQQIGQQEFTLTIA